MAATARPARAVAGTRRVVRRERMRRRGNLADETPRAKAAPPLDTLEGQTVPYTAMVSFRGRRGPPPLPLALGLAVGLALSWQAVARADKNDLNLANLCSSGQGHEQLPESDRDGLCGYQSRFRSMMSELGVVVAPRLLTPADTLGYAGFQFSARAGHHDDQQQPQDQRRRHVGDLVLGRHRRGGRGRRQAARPSTSLTTVGGFVRKGLWFPLPAMEVGAGAIDVLGSHMYAIQGYAKIALQEGFHDWVLPSFAVRGSVVAAARNRPGQAHRLGRRRAGLEGVRHRRHGAD